jgi:phage baseplate assembly protein V
MRPSLRTPSALAGNARLDDMVRLGTVKSVDLDDATAIVTVGEIETTPVPWAATRAGALRVWSPPDEGEQVILLCPDGEFEAAIIIGALWSDERPAPASDGSTIMEWDDGVTLSYNPDTAELIADLHPAGGTALLTAPGGFTIIANVEVEGNVSIEGDLTVDGNAAITGNVSVNGTVAATGTVESDEDVIGGGVSLKDHKHGGVSAGSGLSGTPV